MKLKHYNLYFFIGLLAILAILSLLIVRDLVTVIVSSVVLAYTFYPLQQYLSRKIRNRTLPALAIIAIIIIIITLPLFFIIKTLTVEAASALAGIQSALVSPLPWCLETTILCRAILYLQDAAHSLDLPQILAGVAQSSLSGFGKFAAVVSDLAIKMFIFLFLTFYILRDGDKIVAGIRAHIPLKHSLQERILGKVKDTASAVIYGSVLLAVLQGAAAGVGYLIFGVSSPIIWTIATMFFALIPFLGSWVIWLPIGLSMFAASIAEGSTKGIAMAAGLLIYGTIIVGPLDNILRPILIGNRAQVHPAVILIGAFGGIYAFGAIGFIIGPFILSMTITMVQIFTESQDMSK